MAEHEFKAGEQVEHKSGGGQQMVLIAIDGTDGICQWLSQNKKYQETFPLLALEWIDPNRSIV